MKEAFTTIKFRKNSLQRLAIIDSILEEYRVEGYDLTVRQVYYQMVARGYIENSQKSYDRLADLVNNGRLTGLIDWDMIVDRGRETVTPATWKNPAEIVRTAANQFAVDKWEDQPNHIEVMVEKQALEGVLIPVCQRLGIRFTANKGYSSSSTLYEAGKRLYRKALEGKTVWVLYLGDHDPSGIDMTRDVEDRLNLFAGEVWVNVDRLALNMDQIQNFNPPENPAKETDSRFAAYIARFGSSSWELDALDPRSIDQIVTTAVERLRDNIAWSEAVKREDLMKKELQAFADSYQDNSQEGE